MSRSAAQKASLGLGIVYAAVGVLGFVPAVVMESSQPGQGLLLGVFAVNTIHNIAHLAVAAALVVAATSSNVRTINRGLAALFAVLVVGSLVAPIAEGVAINLPDTGLHLVSMLATGYLGFSGSRRAAAATA